MKGFFRILPLLLLFAALTVAGCSKSGLPGHDLDAVKSKVRTGMSEFQVTTAAGTPNRIDIEGDTRTLQYESNSSNGVVKVVLKQNVVVEVKTE